jgi:hypothetical protein
MKRLFLLLLFVAALWYSWRHWGELIHRQPSHEAVVENTSGREMTRVRLSVGGQTFVKESIPDDSKAAFPFRVDSDATFQLIWNFPDSPAEQSWAGGMVPKGPMLQRHIMTVDGDGAVLYRAENK